MDPFHHSFYLLPFCSRYNRIVTDHVVYYDFLYASGNACQALGHVLVPPGFHNFYHYLYSYILPIFPYHTKVQCNVYASA